MVSVGNGRQGRERERESESWVKANLSKRACFLQSTYIWFQ